MSEIELAVLCPIYYNCWSLQNGPGISYSKNEKNISTESVNTSVGQLDDRFSTILGRYIVYLFIYIFLPAITEVGAFFFLFNISAFPEADGNSLV